MGSDALGFDPLGAHLREFPGGGVRSANERRPFPGRFESRDAVFTGLGFLRDAHSWGFVEASPAARFDSTPGFFWESPPRWGSGEVDPSCAQSIPPGLWGRDPSSAETAPPWDSGEVMTSWTETALSRSPERAATPKTSPGCSRRAAREPAKSWVAASFPKSPEGTTSWTALETGTRSLSTVYSIGPSLQDSGVGKGA